ncbi:DUF2637 domain-containing protein [Kitasatospora sp. NPDC006697]|uniref:DUF2637 domain-containing protein n=1 Tax=Kitasatospora sp. NPDC006697 TaxID=3364020 RepID=UPI0036C76547
MNLGQVRSAERALTAGTWTITVGAVLYSVLTVTPLMAGHTPSGWRWTAPVLPLVVDAAVVIVVRMDSTLARLGGDGGHWPAVLRWLTGVMTVLLNVGLSALQGDLVGVAVHSVAPLLLIVTSETSLAYRRAITAALVAREAAERAERAERGRLAEERQQREREERAAERDRADARERERLAREDEQLRLQREHELRMAREANDAVARREQVEREREEQQRAAEQAEHVEREREASERERREREDAERIRQELLSFGPATARLPEEQARSTAQAAFKAGMSQRQAVQLTGWSAGWIAARYQEAREAQQAAAGAPAEVADRLRPADGLHLVPAAGER